MLLVENRGVFTVARENGSVVGSMKEARLDALAECFIATAREVGAANAATEKRVTGENPTFNFGKEADATLGMTRRADNLQCALPYFDDFAVLQVSVREVAVA